MGLALSTFTTQQGDPELSALAQLAYTGHVVEISEAEPRYEPYNPDNMQELRGQRQAL